MLYEVITPPVVTNPGNLGTKFPAPSETTTQRQGQALTFTVENDRFARIAVLSVAADTVVTQRHSQVAGRQQIGIDLGRKSYNFV